MSTPSIEAAKAAIRSLELTHCEDLSGGEPCEICETIKDLRAAIALEQEREEAIAELFSIIDAESKEDGHNPFCDLCAAVKRVRETQ